jgi:hypothetical protein
MHSEILQPVIVLAAWTMIIWLWMYATRLPAMNRAKIDAKGMVGTIGKELREDLIAAGEVKPSWVADNYNHLHEAPTIFYAVSIVLAIIGQGDGFNASIAWAYVGLRIAHSLVQIVWNRVAVRFVLFALSSIALMMLVTHAGMTLFMNHSPATANIACATATGDC